MDTVVVKFGGTSLATEKERKAISHIGALRAGEKGNSCSIGNGEKRLSLRY